MQATVIMKRSIISRSEGIQLPNNEVIKCLEDRERCKYLGILEADGFKNLQMKKKVRKEYFCRIKEILKSRTNSGNSVKTINSRAVLVTRYGA